MTSPELEPLVEVGARHREPPVRDEYDGLLQNAAALLEDPANLDLHPESRFGLEAT